ncbi:21902_t:CDS:2 [Dentiscutata erythropus]|uniref:21902_t:CDS:1 n=1 Tax=Dentiscutata erythropus TaxID=1348616 RepID=A0A9N8VBX4_9GLOM|nr:21902_t:CDS:2 [Dentiscutata erythropus]
MQNYVKKPNNLNLKRVNLAKVYRISEKSVPDILKYSEYWLGFDDTFNLIQVKYQRKSDNPELEEAISIWVKQVIKNEFTLTSHLLQAKAKKFTNQFKITEFNAYFFLLILRRSWYSGILLSIEILDNNFTSINEKTKLEVSVFEEAELEVEIINLNIYQLMIS